MKYEEYCMFSYKTFNFKDKNEIFSDPKYANGTYKFIFVKDSKSKKNKNNSVYYYFNGKCHREDGPVIVEE